MNQADQPGAPERDEKSAVPQGQHVSRRGILKGFGTGILTVVVVGTGAVAFKGSREQVLDYSAGHAYDPWKDWQDSPGPLGMVAAAILSANPHNTQPWIFRVSSDRIELYADPSRATGALDALGREQMVGLGAALENLILAAGPRGYATTVTLLPDSNAAHVATIGLHRSGQKQASALYRAIGDRHSNRGPYQPAPVAAQAIARLTAQASDLPGLELRWFTTPPERAALGALMIDAAQAIVNDQGQSVDGFAWFRASEAAIEKHRDGLTDWGQDLSDLITSAAVLLPASSRTAGDQFWLTQTKTVHTKTAAAYGVITVRDPGDALTRLRGGQLIERLHLSATVQGLGFQHMNQITERIDREASLGQPPAFSDRFDALLDSPGRTALVSFRIGHPVRPGRLSPRRPVSWVS
ncbi:MAG: hypothetical protein ABSF03_27330 [Streptosporangiaceae bacterium]